MRHWMQVTVAALAVLLLARYFDLWIAGAAAKLTASTGFLLTAVAAGAHKSAYGRWLLGGLFFSWWGDAFLLGGEDFQFQLGLASFLVGHVIYCVAFTVLGLRYAWAATASAIVVPMALVVLWWLLPHVATDFRAPVVAYITVISIMVVLAWGTRGKGGPILIPVGAVLFYLSDLAVSLEQFVVPDVPNYLWGLPLYYFGQMALASSCARAAAPGYTKEGPD